MWYSGLRFLLELDLNAEPSSSTAVSEASSSAYLQSSFFPFFSFFLPIPSPFLKCSAPSELSEGEPALDDEDEPNNTSTRGDYERLLSHVYMGTFNVINSPPIPHTLFSTFTHFPSAVRSSHGAGRWRRLPPILVVV